MRVERFILWAFAALALATAAGCAGRLAAPEWARPTAMDGYAEFLRAKTTRAEGAVDFNTLTSALRVTVLPYNGEVAARAEAMFRDDPLFAREAAAWRPVTVLLGLYAPDLGEKDVTGAKGDPAASRFRPRLMVAGATLAPAGVKRFGRDGAFMRDRFPVFDKWEEVFAVRFEAPAGALGRPMQFILEAPGLTQTIGLAW